MFILGHITCIALFGTLSWQDFRTRLISVWLLPACTVAFGACELNQADIGDVLLHFLVNVAQLALLFTVLTVWISARAGHYINIVDSHIGLGDLLLLLALAPICSPFNFCLLFTCAAVIGVIAWSVYPLLQNRSLNNFPLAGVIGSVLIAYVVLKMTDAVKFSISDDGWLSAALWMDII